MYRKYNWLSKEMMKKRDSIEQQQKKVTPVTAGEEWPLRKFAKGPGLRPSSPSLYLAPELCQPEPCLSAIASDLSWISWA